MPDDNDIPSVSSSQFIRALLTLGFTEIKRTKNTALLTKAKLKRRISVPLGQDKLLPIYVKKHLAAASVSNERFILALKKNRGRK